MDLGDSILQDRLRLKPLTVLPANLRAGDILYLDGCPNYETGVYFCFGFSPSGVELLYPFAERKDMIKYFRKKDLI